MTDESATDASSPPTSSWQRHPALLVMAVAVVLVAAVLAWPLLNSGTDAPASEELPWHIELLPGGNARVFGLTIGADTLGQARQRWGDDMRVAIVAAHQETGALEASVERYTAGFLTGRLILSMDVAPDVLARWRSHVRKREYVEGGSSLEALQQDDLAEALGYPIVGVSFIPSVDLDADTVRKRFGPPAERLPLDGREHWLYPDQGLDLALDPEKRELLQYVAPRDFEARLHQPLLRAIASAAAGSGASDAGSAAAKAGPEAPSATR